MPRQLSPRLPNGTKMVSQRQIMGENEKIAVYMTSALVAGVAVLGESAHEFTRAIYSSIGSGEVRRRYIKEANLQLARGAQEEIQDHWRSRLPVGAPGYRAGSDPDHDRLHGYLGRALSDQEAMIRGTTDRAISFINVSHLNNEARHWYRVNYGAWGPKAILRRPKPFPVTVGGHSLFVLRDEAQPARNSWLPRAYTTEGANWFAPRYAHDKNGRRIANKADVHGGGHRAAVFTDLGFEYVAQNLDPTYDNMFRRFVKEQGPKIPDSSPIVVNANGPRPTVSGPNFRPRSH